MNPSDNGPAQPLDEGRNIQKLAEYEAAKAKAEQEKKEAEEKLAAAVTTGTTEPQSVDPQVNPESDEQK